MTGWFIGRFQLWHKGHQAMLGEILKECEECIIIIKGAKESKDNPYSVIEVKQVIEGWLVVNKLNKIVSVQIVFGDSENMTVYCGRDVGWDFKQIRLPKEIEAISATKIRNENSRL